MKENKNCWLNTLLLNGKVHVLRSVERVPQNRRSVSKPSPINVNRVQTLLLVERGYGAKGISRMEMSQAMEYLVICA